MTPVEYRDRRRCSWSIATAASVRRSQVHLESLGLRVEVFASLAERAERAPAPARCILCGLDAGSQSQQEFDDLLAEMGEGMPVVLLGRAPPLSLVVRALKAGAVDVLRRPVDADELGARCRRRSGGASRSGFSARASPSSGSGWTGSPPVSARCSTGSSPVSSTSRSARSWASPSER